MGPRNPLLGVRFPAAPLRSPVQHYIHIHKSTANPTTTGPAAQPSVRAFRIVRCGWTVDVHPALNETGIPKPYAVIAMTRFPLLPNEIQTKAATAALPRRRPPPLRRPSSIRPSSARSRAPRTRSTAAAMDSRRWLLHAGDVMPAVRTRWRSSALLRSVSAILLTVDLVHCSRTSPCKCGIQIPKPNHCVPLIQFSSLKNCFFADQQETERGVVVLVTPVVLLLRPGPAPC